MAESSGSGGPMVGQVAERIHNDMEAFKNEVYMTSQDDLEWVRHTLKHTKGFQVSLLQPPFDFHALGPRKMILWRHQVSAGLLLPAPEFIRQVCELFRVPVSQIFHSSLRKAIAFHIIVASNGCKAEDSANLFFQTQIRKHSRGFYSFQSYPGAEIESNFGLAQHELHRSHSDVDREEDVRTFSPAVLAYIRALNNACKKEGKKRRLPKLKMLTESDAALAATGLFECKEALAHGKDQNPFSALPPPRDVLILPCLFVLILDFNVMLLLPCTGRAWLEDLQVPRIPNDEDGFCHQRVNKTRLAQNPKIPPREE